VVVGPPAFNRSGINVTANGDRFLMLERVGTASLRDPRRSELGRGAQDEDAAGKARVTGIPVQGVSTPEE